MPYIIPKDHPKTLDEYLKREAEIRASVWYAKHLAGESRRKSTTTKKEN